MFDQLMTILKGDAPPQPPDVKLAVAVLLLEAAHRDDQFGQTERAAVGRLIQAKFGLGDAECAQLLAETEARQREMVQLHPYTHAVFEQMDPAGRIGVVEMLWEVAYADGELHAEEDALIRRIAGLIYVEDRDRILARQRVLARLGKV